MTTLTEREALFEVIDMQRRVLDEIAFGNEWGGPAKDHISYMRGIAFDVLEHGIIEDVL